MNTHASPKATKATPYTPTHTADGRKLTRAERKAANRAKWAAEQAARKADAPKPKGKGKRKGKQAPKPAPAPAPAAKQAPMKVAALKAWMEANPRRKQVTAQEVAEFTQAPAPAEGEGEGEPAPAPLTQGLIDTWVFCSQLGELERKRVKQEDAPVVKQTRKERKEAWLESKAQRESMRKQAGRRAKENEGSTIVVGADGGDAHPYERRMEVPAPPKRERKRKPLPTLPEEFYAMDDQRFNYFSRAGLIPTDDVTMDDCI
jgi:hypothetical protein